MRVGILTAGGDCPGLNAVISSVARRSWDHGHELLGFKYGWRGVIDDDTMPLNRDNVRGIMREGGTILRSSGDNPAHGGAYGPSKFDRGCDMPRGRFTQSGRFGRMLPHLRSLKSFQPGPEALGKLEGPMDAGQDNPDNERIKAG